MSKKATLSIEGYDPIELDIQEGALGNPVIDISKLSSQGFFTHDPDFVATSSCESSITYIDGDKGVLLHRGYSIEDLSTKSTFLEVCYLIFNGELPSKKELSDFEDDINKHSLVHASSLF